MSAVMRACQEMEIPAEACALLSPAMSPHAAVSALVEAGQIREALKLLTYLLPRRYVVAWLCQCARGEALNDEDRAGAALAEQWVRDPSERNRRAAYEFANAGGYESIGAWMAAAAGWSGGSLAPADQEAPVPPTPDLTARAAVAAVNLLAAHDADNFEARRAAFAGNALALLGDQTIESRG